MHVVFLESGYFVPALFTGDVRSYLKAHGIDQVVNRGNTERCLVRRGRIYRAPSAHKNEQQQKKTKSDIRCPHCSVVLDYIPFDISESKRRYCPSCGEFL